MNTTVSKHEPQGHYEHFVDNCSPTLPEGCDGILVHRTVRPLGRRSELLVRWMHWLEIAAIAQQSGLIAADEIPLFKEALDAFDFTIAGENLVVGEYEIQPMERGWDYGWFRVGIHPQNQRAIVQALRRKRLDCDGILCWN